jgi:hypothetical protein
MENKKALRPFGSRASKIGFRLFFSALLAMRPQGRCANQSNAAKFLGGMEMLRAHRSGGDTIKFRETIS